MIHHCLASLVLIGIVSSVSLKGEEIPGLFVEGYTGQVSYAPGEELTLHLSSSVPQVAVEISRIGAKKEVVWSNNGVPSQTYPVPVNASSHGCAWPTALKLPIPRDWKSGYYSIRLRVEDRGGAFVQRNVRTAEGNAFFVLRSADPGKGSPILLQLSTNTYNAYNNWGGFSLYAYNGRGGNQGHRVSFQRPPSSQFGRWEQPFVEWAESNGYEFEFAANSDLEFHPEIVEKYQLVLSVGHDEYWSAPMRDTLEAYIKRGGNVAFFSGNSVCWQVRSEDNGSALVCYKQNYFVDPVYRTGDHKLLSTTWSHHLVGRPENQLTGVGFLYGGYRKSHGQFMEEPAEYTVHRPEHWVFQGTALKQGDRFGDKDTIVGYECDGCELEWKNGLPFATTKDGTPSNFEVIATCPAKWALDDCEWYEKWEKGRVGNSVIGTHSIPNGGTVFTCGSTDWSHGLAGNDPAVIQITKNVLDKLSKK